MSIKMLRKTMDISISQNYLRVSLSCDDVNKALEEIEALEGEVEGLYKEKRELKKALIGHRWDLHDGSKRPCATCRESARVLGLEVPNGCAKERWDKEAMPVGI